MTLGPDGALWFIETCSGVDLSDVGRITTAGDFTMYPLPSGGYYPVGIATGSDGALWIGYGLGELGRMTTAGDFTVYPFPAPLYSIEITTGADGALWFTASPNQIGRMTTSGESTLYTLPSPSAYPDYIAAGPDGALWFTEANKQIGRITTSGVVTEFNVPGDAAGITTGPDGALWFTEAIGNSIGRITTNGLVTVYPAQTTDGGLGITAGPDGALWFTDYIYSKIERAPACGLGFTASFSGSTLTMKFDLGIATPATFDILLHSASGVSEPFSKPIQAVVPPRAFTLTWPGIPNLGEVKVEPILNTASGQAICAEFTTVNTAP